LARDILRHFWDIFLPWSQVLFVSTVPGVRRHPSGWNTFREEPITEAALAENLRFWAFQRVIQNRETLRKSSSFLTWSWLILSLPLRPLWTAEGRPHATQGALDLNLNVRWVRRNGGAIIPALEAF
jgi:hypothetical protein